MKLLFKFIVLFILCSGNGCETPPGVEAVYSIYFVDFTGKGYDFLVSYNYPDTLIPNVYNKIRGVPPNDKVPFDSHEEWQDVFEELPTDTLTIFLFTEIITTENWQQIRSNYEVEKRYDISFQDLERLNYVIPYPLPDSLNIKTYP